MDPARHHQLWTRKERRLLRGVRLESAHYKAIVLAKRLFGGRVVEVRPRRTEARFSVPTADSEDTNGNRSHAIPRRPE